MAGGRNQPNQRENDSDEDAELSDSEVNYQFQLIYYCYWKFLVIIIEEIQI